MGDEGWTRIRPVHGPGCNPGTCRERALEHQRRWEDHDKQRRAPQHEAEPRTNRAKADIQTVEEQLREKERYLQIREAEVQKMLRAVDERREAMTLQADGLQQKSATMREWEENLRLREAALTQQMANERQRDRRSNGAASASFSSPSDSEIPPGTLTSTVHPRESSRS